MSQHNDEEIESFEPDDAVDNRPGMDEDLDVEGDEDSAPDTDGADDDSDDATTTMTTMTTTMTMTSPRMPWPTRSTSWSPRIARTVRSTWSASTTTSPTTWKS